MHIRVCVHRDLHGLSIAAFHSRVQPDRRACERLRSRTNKRGDRPVTVNGRNVNSAKLNFRSQTEMEKRTNAALSRARARKQYEKKQGERYIIFARNFGTGRRYLRRNIIP